jgi:hypothetical protein
MKQFASSVVLALTFAAAMHVASAQAQLVRTCVSQLRGSDANVSSSCHCSTPCRTFATAHNSTLANGEITVLDPGDYGGLTITKSISINNDSGGEASMTVSGNTTGIIVNAPVDGYVNLRGLTIQGVGFGTTTGLRFNTGLFLTMTSCVVRNHTGAGIELFPNAASTFELSNVLTADNGDRGIFLKPSGSGIVKATFNRVEAYNNSNAGIQVYGSGSTNVVRATATDTVSAGNAANGFLVFAGNGTAATNLLVVRSTAANNGGTGFGASNSTQATLRLSQSTASNNLQGIGTSGTANLLSASDNVVEANVTDGTPTGTFTKK